MQQLVINSYDEFAAYLGKELGVSDWLPVDQERINKFADATLDPQWIHVDVERAKRESPYKSTIAHGYLMVNHGMDQMKFGQAVVTGSRIRLVAKLKDITNLRGICRAAIDFKIEIEGQRKPALQGIATFLYYFK